MIRESESEPSGEELIALIGALRAENAALKARIAEFERLWLPKFRSGRIRKMRQNQRIIAFDARDPPLACPPRDELIERLASILGIDLDELFVKAERLPPDLRRDLPRVVAFYRRGREMK